MIKHHSYKDGAVQSLGFVAAEQDYTVGVVQPGAWDFGTSDRPETLKIILGILRVNGSVIGLNEQFTIEEGQPIQIEAEEVAVYLCSYGIRKRLHPIFARHVVELQTSVRSCNNMTNNGIETIAQLVQYTRTYLMEYAERPFGRKWLDEIEQALENIGLRFGMVWAEMLAYVPPKS